jgi:hypothetical protein
MNENDTGKRNQWQAAALKVKAVLHDEKTFQPSE